MKRLPILASAASLALTTTAAAAGFYLQEQSVRGLGRAYSGEAADTGGGVPVVEPRRYRRTGGRRILCGPERRLQRLPGDRRRLHHPASGPAGQPGRR